MIVASSRTHHGLSKEFFPRTAEDPHIALSTPCELLKMPTPHFPDLKQRPDGTETVIRIGPKFSRTQPLIENWCKAISRYCAAWPGEDAPYWRNERANVSMLAGAAWMSGAAAMEEYGTEKTFEDAKKNGRADLYITWLDHDCAIEAKYCWFGKDKPRNLIGAVMNANSDARTNRDSATVYAVVFAALYRKPTEFWAPSEMIEAIARYVPRPDIFAAHFPGHCRELKGEDGYICPGVALIMNRVRN